MNVRSLKRQNGLRFILCKHQQVKFLCGQVQFADTKCFSFPNTTSTTLVFPKLKIKTCGFCTHCGIARCTVCCNTVQEYTTKAEPEAVAAIITKARICNKNRSEKRLAQNNLHKISLPPPHSPLVCTAMYGTC